MQSNHLSNLDLQLVSGHEICRRHTEPSGGDLHTDVQGISGGWDEV